MRSRNIIIFRLVIKTAKIDFKIVSDTIRTAQIKTEIIVCHYNTNKIN